MGNEAEFWRPHPGDGAFAFLAPEKNGMVHLKDWAIYTELLRPAHRQSS